MYNWLCFINFHKINTNLNSSDAGAAAHVVTDDDSSEGEQCSEEYGSTYSSSSTYTHATAAANAGTCK